MSTRVFELWTKEIPTRIFNQILLTDEIIKLIIVSPWITPHRDQPLLKILCRRIHQEEISAMVVTRTPKYTWHEIAVSMLEKAGARIYYNDYLHAKIVLVKAVSLDYGFFGTANLTYNANFTDDVVIFVKGTGEGKYILERLTLYAYHLK